MFSIYVIYDPADANHVRYVGYTSGSLTARISRHLSDLRRTHRCNWLRKVLAEGRRPQIRCIDTAKTQNAAHELERFHIQSHLAAGHRLTNSTAGGEGLLNPSSEVRAKLSASKIGNKYSLGSRRTPEVRLRMSEAQRARNYSPSLNTRHKMGDGNRGRVQSRTEKDLRAASLRGQRRNDETRKRMSEAHCRPEVREKCDHAWHSPEAVAKVAAANRGRKRTLQTRALMSDRIKVALQDPRIRQTLREKAFIQHFVTCVVREVDATISRSAAGVL